MDTENVQLETEEVVEEEVEEVVEEVLTPLENAYSNYRELRRQGYSNLSKEERQWYFAYRGLRNYTKYWRKNSQKEYLVSSAKKSLEKARAKVAQWEPFETWLNSLALTEEMFSEKHGGIDINGNRVIRGPGWSTSSKWRDIYKGHKKVLSILQGDVSNELNSFRNQIELVADAETDEDFFTSITDEITEAGIKGGLEPVDEKNARDDGALWFRDPDTDVEYYFLLGTFNKYYKYEIQSSFKVMSSSNHWKELPFVNLAVRGIVPLIPSIRMNFVGNRLDPRSIRRLDYVFNSAPEPAPRDYPWLHRFA